MTDLRKAAEMALNALEFNCPVIEDYGSKEQLKTYNESTMALYKALAQSDKQEPVAWIGNADFVKGQFVEGRVRRVWWECNTGVGQPLYAAPPKREWVGLTDDEINKIVDLNTSDDGGFDIWCDGIAVAHIVCAKIKELNK